MIEVLLGFIGGCVIGVIPIAIYMYIHINRVLTMRLKGKKPIFNYKDCWSMDMTLSPIIHAGLVKFKEELVKHPFAGYPSDFHKGDDEKDSEASYQEWLDTLSKMIYAFDEKNEPDITTYNFTFETEWKTLGNGNSELISIDPTDRDG